VEKYGIEFAVGEYENFENSEVMILVIGGIVEVSPLRPRPLTSFPKLPPPCAARTTFPLFKDVLT
jgi:hypothetical protein